MATCPAGGGDRGPVLGDAATAFYADLRLVPVLRQVLDRSDRLLGGTAGSISLVEEGGDRYVKAAERGASCQLGRRFPLDEGVTGQVVARRGPVLLERYGDLRTGHLPAGRPETQGAVAAVPIWWRGEVIGVNVLFAGSRGAFTVDQVDELELLTQVAAAAIVTAGHGDPSLAHVLRSRSGGAGVTTTVTEVGPVRPVPPAVAGVAVDLLGLAEAAAARHDTAARLHVAVLHGGEAVRLVLQDEHPVDGQAADQDAAVELVARAGGAATVERVPGWGTLVRAALPYAPAAAPPAPPPAATPPAVSPLSPREAEVVALLARGLSDREIAEALVLSPKTVEKHVAAVRRKAGARTRTAAVVHALTRGWVTADAARRDCGDGGSPPYP